MCSCVKSLCEFLKHYFSLFYQVTNASCHLCPCLNLLTFQYDQHHPIKPSYALHLIWSTFDKMYFCNSIFTLFCIIKHARKGNYPLKWLIVKQTCPFYLLRSINTENTPIFICQKIEISGDTITFPRPHNRVVETIIQFCVFAVYGSFQWVIRPFVIWVLLKRSFILGSSCRSAYRRNLTL